MGLITRKLRWLSWRTRYWLLDTRSGRRWHLAIAWLLAAAAVGHFCWIIWGDWP